MRDTLLSNPGSRATGSRSGHGSDSTHCRTGTAGHSRVTCSAAVSFMRRPPHDAHTPRRLHENGTSRSKPHAWQRARPKPPASTPQRRKARSSASTYGGSATSAARAAARKGARSACTTPYSTVSLAARGT
jgi:hypothetical protein